MSPPARNCSLEHYSALFPLLALARGEIVCRLLFHLVHLLRCASACYSAYLPPRDNRCSPWNKSWPHARLCSPGYCMVFRDYLTLARRARTPLHSFANVYSLLVRDAGAAAARWVIRRHTQVVVLCARSKGRINGLLYIRGPDDYVYSQSEIPRSVFVGRDQRS